MNRLTLPALAIASSTLFLGSEASYSEGTRDLNPDYSDVEVLLEQYRPYSDSFWDVPPLEGGFVTTNPADRNDGITVGELSREGGDAQAVIQLANEIAANNEENYDSLLIARGDKLVFESYFKSGRVNLPHPQASATKSYTGILLGRAIQLGYLAMDDLDQPLVGFLEEVDRSSLADGAEHISLHEALTMTTGIRLDDEEWSEMRDNPDRVQGQKQVQFVLERSEPITAQSKTFKYGTGPDLIMQVIEAVVPDSAEKFIQAELLDKLGINEYEWQSEVNGLPAAGWQTSFTSRDMIKFGRLIMNKGRWNGEQLIPEAYVERSTRPSVFTGDEDIYGGGPDVSKIGYGYFWWTAELQSGGKTYFVANAQGGGGQYIILAEDLDLLIVVTGHSNDNTTLQRTAAQIFPAFVESQQPGN